MTKPVVTLRNTKGSALSYTELDTNFSNLKDATIGITVGSDTANIDLNSALTVVGGTNVTLSLNTSTKTLTINSSGGSGGVTNPLTSNLELAAYSLTQAPTYSGSLSLLCNNGFILARYDYPTDTRALNVTFDTAKVNVAANSASSLELQGSATGGVILKAYTSGGYTGQITVTGSSIGTTVESITTRLNLQANNGPSIQLNNSGGTEVIISSITSGTNYGEVGIVANTVLFNTDNNDSDPIQLSSPIGVGSNPTTGFKFIGRYIQLPSRTTTQRDALSAVNGMLLYNSTTNRLQTYSNSTWTSVATDNGPAFRAYPTTAQTITSGSLQKVNFGSETYDTNSNFASSRFTPTVEGYYQVTSTVRLDGGGNGTGECMIVIYKNGTEYARGWNSQGTQFASDWWSMSVSDVVYANGSTDYFEIYIQQGSGANRTTTPYTNISFFSGCLIRGV